MAQSVKHPALSFGSHHDLMVHEFKPQVRLELLNVKMLTVKC